MLRTTLVAALAGIAMGYGFVGSAQAQGTADEAKALLDKVVAAVKADKAKAIGMFNSGEGGFKDRDLYPACFNIADGVMLSGPPTLIGKDVRTFKSPAGADIGALFYKAAEDGKINTVDYEVPKPGTTNPLPKRSFVTKVGDLACGVGYYK